LQPETTDDLLTKLYAGDRRAAGRLMTLVEQDPFAAKQIIQKIHPFTGHANILGITGAPGVGKSTLINALIDRYLEQNLSIGVVMVDPSSPFSGGAILGDRIRLKTNYSQDRVFIRSMASRGQLGGMALATKDIVKILDVMGCDLILIETVGVGQSEVEIFKAADTILVMLVPGLGDEIQTIKAGILEITDIFVVNKMDLPGADKVVLDLQSMLGLDSLINLQLTHDEDHNMQEIMQNSENEINEESRVWQPPIVLTNAKSGENIDLLIEKIALHQSYCNQTMNFQSRLKLRYKSEILDIVRHRLTEQIDDYLNSTEMEQILTEIIQRKQDPYSCAEQILRERFNVEDITKTQEN
jgi:LAO/AO transport system kinase